MDRLPVLFEDNHLLVVNKPAGIATDIPGLKSGDIVLLAYAAAGIFLTFKLVQDLRRHRRSLYLFVVALLLIAVAATQDSLNLRILKTPTVRHVQIVAEEVAEVWAQALFAISMLGFFFFKLRRLVDAPSGAPD